MIDLNALKNAGLFDKNVPRYTSYPTAPQFHDGIGRREFALWLAGLDPAQPASLYVHVPFCERLCWFCACRTQGVNTPAPVQAYVETLLQEIAMFKATRPDGLKLTRLHFGGGSPTILSPDMITRITDAIADAAPFDPEYEFSVEIDPTACTDAKIAAFAKAGMNRASIGVQDFNEKVQEAIGRPQGYELTRDLVASLRAHGIGSVNIDMVYGLPHQDLAALENTTRQVMTLSPDRVALFGYAHVPWMAKRQRMIPEESLPNPFERLEQAEKAAQMFVEAGLSAIGIDHFAKPADSLAIAAANGHLRRNFQGYTDDRASALIGLGASSISRFPQGYIQNNVATANYTKSIEAGEWPAVKGYALGLEDKLRSRAIEMLMCDFRLDLAELQRDFGDVAAKVRADCARVARDYPQMVALDDNGLTIHADARNLTRILASEFDGFMSVKSKHSQAI